MSGAFTHTDQTDAIIRAGYAVNRPVREIAAELGVTKNVVIGRARRIGLASQDRLRAAIRQPRSPESVQKQMRTINEMRSQAFKRNKAEIMFRQGLSYLQIAEKLDLNYDQVRYAVTRRRGRSA